MFRILIGLLLILTIQIPEEQPVIGLFVFLSILSLMIWGAHDVNNSKK